jgi:hypothetical protein
LKQMQIKKKFVSSELYRPVAWFFCNYHDFSESVEPKSLFKTHQIIRADYIF